LNQRLSGRAVLLADDDPDNLELIAFIFGDAGATVRTAGTSEDVLALLREWRPAVMLLDISMPEMNGYDLLAAIRSDPAMREVPAIAVTGAASDHDRRQAVAAGFAAHVSKPFDGEALVHLVRELTERAPPRESADRVAFLEALRHGGLHGALDFLNGRSLYRFTGIYRFDGVTLRNVELFDRADPAIVTGEDPPLGETYCSIVRLGRERFATADAMADPRLVDHPARRQVRSYCGSLLRNADGTPFGTLCSFDLVARPASDAFLELLELVAPIVSAHVVERG
jgi:CheY-like chemotaxis protein